MVPSRIDRSKSGKQFYEYGMKSRNGGHKRAAVFFLQKAKDVYQALVEDAPTKFKFIAAEHCYDLAISAPSALGHSSF